MPTSTDLVTDLPADFDVALQGVDTRLKALNPETTLGDISFASATANTNTRLPIGTTGQVLAVVAGVPAWQTGTTGDIEGVTAGVGISGGGTSGTVTVTNSMATAITTNGDLIYGTGSGTFARLGIGSTDQVLKVTGGIPAWATATTTAPGLAFVTSATFTAATTVSINSCFTSTYDNYVVTVNLSAGSGAGGNYYAKLRLSGTDSSASYAYNTLTTNGTTVSSATLNGQTTGFPTDSNDQSRPAQTQFTLMSPAVGVYTWFASNAFSSNMGGQGVKINNGYHAIATAYDGLTLNWSGAATGTVRVYGMRNS